MDSVQGGAKRSFVPAQAQSALYPFTGSAENAFHQHVRVLIFVPSDLTFVTIIPLVKITFL